ncbi:hypothetical protein [Actinophytocola glycyrrhizae]|uniref:Uncharacterized protein n=1 Tax=Actinophytocola glycyrrhizae TaxID=2044873 RepID=A0ABV9RW10_9PSEU
MRVEPGLAADGTFRIGVDQDFLLNNEVTATTPEPDSVSVDGRYLVYEFPAEPSTGMAIRFDLRPSLDNWVGVQQGQVRVAASSPVRFSQLVYP